MSKCLFQTAMGMGTLVSSYPRGLEDTSGGVMVPLGIPQPVVTPLHAWEPHAITSEGQESSASHLTFLCAGSKGKNAFNKVCLTLMLFNCLFFRYQNYFQTPQMHNQFSRDFCTHDTEFFLKVHYRVMQTPLKVTITSTRAWKM